MIVCAEGINSQGGRIWGETLGMVCAEGINSQGERIWGKHWEWSVLKASTAKHLPLVLAVDTFSTDHV